jgi:type VI secretion system protein ImpE
MNAKELYQTGQLVEAIAAAGEEVKQRPTDLGCRALLCELLCFAGNLDRADLQLDAMGHQAPEAAMVVSLFRQLVRAEQARRQFFEEGRLPDFLTEPPEHLKRRLEASIRIREGKPAEAASLLDEAERLRPPVSGVCDGTRFEEIRDLDDMIGSVFEALTSTGKYYWIPAETIDVIEFRPPGRPRDLLWRPARMVVRGGPDGEVFLPTLYAGTYAETDDRIRLGRYTDWRGGDGQPTRGVGLRMLLVGEDARTILELKQIAFDSPEASGREADPDETTS